MLFANELVSYCQQFLFQHPVFHLFTNLTVFISFVLRPSRRTYEHFFGQVNIRPILNDQIVVTDEYAG